LTAPITYRHILAAFLLAVYSFIATPVQLWHHHKHISKATQETVSLGTKGDLVSQGSGLSSEANCLVCAHKYSTYIDNAIFPFETSLTLPVVKNGYYSLPLVSISSFHLPNKGPPALS
jgi:hypothetical protein